MTQGTSPPEQKRGAVVGERAEPQCRTCLRPAGCLAAPSQDSGDGAVPGTHAVGDKLPPTLGTPPRPSWACPASKPPLLGVQHQDHTEPGAPTLLELAPSGTRSAPWPYRGGSRSPVQPSPSNSTGRGRQCPRPDPLLQKGFYTAQTHAALLMHCPSPTVTRPAPPPAPHPRGPRSAGGRWVLHREGLGGQRQEQGPTAYTAPGERWEAKGGRASPPRVPTAPPSPRHRARGCPGSCPAAPRAAGGAGRWSLLYILQQDLSQTFVPNKLKRSVSWGWLKRRQPAGVGRGGITPQGARSGRVR